MAPQVPTALTSLQPAPLVPVGGTQADVAAFIAEQEAARRACYGNMAAVRAILDQWQESIQ